MPRAVVIFEVQSDLHFTDQVELEQEIRKFVQNRQARVSRYRHLTDDILARWEAGHRW